MSEIGYACVVARKFTDESSISFQCNFETGADPAQINAELDKLLAVMERQQAKIDVEALKRQIATQEVNLKKQGDMIRELKSKIDQPADPQRRVQNHGALRTQYDQALITYEESQKNVERAKAFLAETEKKAA